MIILIAISKLDSHSVRCSYNLEILYQSQTLLFLSIVYMVNVIFLSINVFDGHMFSLIPFVFSKIDDRLPDVDYHSGYLCRTCR